MERKTSGRHAGGGYFTVEFSSDEFKNNDVYQLLAYCTATDTRRGVLVYPMHINSAREKVQILNTEICIRQITIDLGKELGELVRTCDSFADEVFACVEL